MVLLLLLAIEENWKFWGWGGF